MLAGPPAPAAAKSVGNILSQINVWRLLWRTKWLMLACMIIGALFSVVLLVMQRPIYRASTVLEILSVNEKFMGMSDVDPQSGNYTMNAVNLQTQLRILGSRSMLNRIVERVNMEQTPVAVPSGGSWLQKLRLKFGQLPQQSSALTQEAIQMSAMTLNSRALGATRLIEISCESISPDVAATFVNSTAQEFMSSYAQAKSTSSVRTTQWIESQLAEAKTKIEQVEEKMQKFVRKSGSEVLLEQNSLANIKLKQLQAELAAAQGDRISKQSRIEFLKNNRADQLSDVDVTVLQELRSKLSALQVERSQLLVTRTPDNYKVRAVDAQIARVQQQMDVEMAALQQKAKNDFDAAARREQMLANAYAAQSGQVMNQYDKSGEYTVLRRELELAQQAYNFLLQQLNQTSLIAVAPSNAIRVIDPALPSSMPVKPRPLRELSIGVFVGALLALAFGAWRELRALERRKDFVSELATLGESLQLPQLGAIPKLSVQRKLLAAASAEAGWRRTLARVRAGGDDDQEVGLVTWKKGPSLLGESFRQVWLSIFMGPQSHGRQVIVVTSPGAGEGKTTVSSNLAIATAEARRRVLLVDGDLRHPRAHEVFSLPKQTGLAELLMEEGEITEQDLARFIQTTMVPNLFVLPGGLQKVDVLSPLLLTERTKRLIELLRTLFDTIIIDTAPALYFADARQFGMFSDGVVFVFRAQSTHQETAQDIARTFQSDHIPVLGVVLNDWEPRHTQQLYYYAQQYSRYQSAFDVDAKPATEENPSREARTDGEEPAGSTKQSKES
jgi:capsular exopolysaccharide synthesis family protein